MKIRNTYNVGFKIVNKDLSIKPFYVKMTDTTKERAIIKAWEFMKRHNFHTVDILGAEKIK